MRNVCYSVAMSLDGYITGPKGEIDWILADPEIDFATFFAGYDTVVAGRRSYEAAREMGSGLGTPGMEAHVVSSSLRQEDCPDVTVTSEAVSTVRELKARPGKDIWLFGGGELFRSLLEAGLVDRVQVAVIPVLLGGGVPLLPGPTARARLVLTGHRVYEKTGTVLLDYDVVRDEDPGSDSGSESSA
jgi:dihydrofolate reductase